MPQTYQGIVIAVLVSITGVIADSLLKSASRQTHMIANRWFFGALALTVAFSFGWLVLMRHMKLATAGAIYAVLSATLLAIIGVIFFEERLSPAEVTGIGMAVGSVILLSRFAA